MELWNLKSQVFRKYILYYTIMLCLPICVFSGIIYNSVVGNLRQKAIAGCQYDSVRIAGQLDDQFLQYRRIRDTLMNTSWVIRFRSNSNVFDGEFDVFKRNSICNELLNYKSLNSGIDNVAVYFPQKNTVFDPAGWFPLDVFLDKTGISRADKDEFLALARGAGDFSYAGGANGELLYVQRLELVTDPRAVLVLFLNKAYFDRFIRGSADDMLTAYEVSGNGGTLLESKDAPGEDANAAYPVTMRSGSLLFTYHFTYRLDAVSPTLGAYSFIFLATAISLALGALIALMLASLSYTPLKRLMKKLFNSEEIAGKTGDYEYGLINSAFDKLFTEKKEMQVQVLRYEGAARSDMLRRLLVGYFDDVDALGRINEFGLKYGEERLYRVIMLGEGGAAQKPGYTRTGMFTLYNAADRVLQSMGASCQIAELEGNIVAILDFDAEEAGRAIPERFLEAFRVVEEALALHASIAFGTVEEGILGISKSYQAAKEERRKAISRSTIIQMNSPAGRGLLCFYPTDWEVQLINRLKVGDIATVRRILDEIKSENEKRGCDESSVVRLASGIIEMMTRILCELHMDTGDSDDPKNELILIRQAENLQWYWDYAYMAGEKICDRIMSVKAGGGDSMPKKIIEYIDGNITDNNLSLKELGDKFGLSVSSISKQFKDNTGINFYDYICRVRMEKAKELLAGSWQSIQQIAKAVGYENDYSFKRAFLRYEGVKPEDYKSSRLHHGAKQ